MRTILLLLTMALAGATSLCAADPPPNDNFTNRFFVTGSSLSVTSCNLNASKELREPTIKYDNGQTNGGGKSVWWGWTPSVSGPAHVSSFGSSFDTILGVYTGTSVTNLTWITGNDDAASGTQSIVTFNAVAGTQYQIVVDGWGGASGTVVANMHITNSVPSIYLACPTNNGTYTVPATVPLTAYASDFTATTPWPNGITNVSFYQNGVFIKRGSTNTSSPIMFTNTVSLGLGSYTFTAVSYNRNGQTNLSPVANVTVIGNVPPIVSVTNPVNGATLYTPLNLSVLTYAFDPYGGTVTNVEIFTNSVKMGQDLTAPYSNYWASVPLGTHTLTARAWDNGGLSTTSDPVTFTVVPNIPPTVSITNPVNGAKFPSAGTITINAVASDNVGGSITNVSFYSGGVKLGQDTAAPYSFSWSNVASGTYTLTAVAWDNGGLSSTSAPISVTVVPNTPPTVSITSPTDGQEFKALANITLTATASDTEGPVTNVAFYSNGTLIGQDSSSPFSFTWNNIGIGTYIVTAVAYDSANLTATSAPVTIVVTNSTPPTVSITSPVANATFTAGLDMAILATASDSDGTVSKVEFYQGSTKLGESSTSPYSFIWSNVAAGTYALTAVATDNSTTTGTSAIINVTVGAVASWQTNLIPGESIWKYLDNGSDQGTAWRGLTFNDSSWVSGKAQFGYGDGDEVTTVSYGTDAANKYITTYFRRTMVITNNYRYTNLILHLIRDDGAVVYINSNEVYRSNMPDGTPSYSTLAANSAAALEESIAWITANLTNAGSILRNGTNILAVEMHQNAANSTDLSFDLELIGELAPVGNQPPSVAISYPRNGAVFYLPNAVVTNTVTASDSDGTVTNVDLYANGVLLGRDRTAPYSFIWSNMPANTYSLVAVAFDNNGATNTSAPVNITVTTGGGDDQHLGGL